MIKNRYPGANLTEWLIDIYKFGLDLKFLVQTKNFLIFIYLTIENGGVEQIDVQNQDNKFMNKQTF
ncbi:MAG: hypothetical protein EA359_16035 [Balneolaceae bacterium]|nr:MAG: hypothetical protein EA359_16035 [Balneolaceae bacterium]